MSADRPARRIGTLTGALLQLAAAAVFTLVLLALAELAASPFVPSDTRPADDPNDTVSRTLAWLELNPAPLVPDVDLLWRNQPLARRTLPVNPQPYARHDTWTIENNSLGYRGPERAPQDGPVYRILCIGDSVTFGFNADQHHTYPVQLAELLRARHPAAPLEVINAGVSGWSWLQGLRFLEGEGVDLEPDLVIIAHGTNDQILPARITDEERLGLLGGPLRRRLHRARLALSHTNVYRALQGLAPALPVEDSTPSRGCAKQIAEYGSCRRVSLDEITDVVHEVRRITDQRGIDLLVLNLDFVGTRAVEGTRRAVAGDGTAFIDPVARIEALTRRSDDDRARRRGLAPSHPTAPADPAARTVVLRVLVPPGAGSYSVRGHVDLDPTEVTEPMYDDGTHGDEVGGDRVFTSRLTLRADAHVLGYKYELDGVSEFVPLPPLRSTHGDRGLPLGSDVVGPVDLFGRVRFMAERAHPTRSGHTVVAKLAAGRVERLDSFRRFVDAAERRAAQSQR